MHDTLVIMFGIIRVIPPILSASPISTLAPVSLNHAVNSPRVELSQIREPLDSRARLDLYPGTIDMVFRHP